MILAIAILTTTISVLAATGTTDAPNAPGLTASYTLENIYQRLRNGSAGSQSTFNEPAVAPGTGSMHTLNDIMAAAPVLDNTNGATSEDVLAGNTFWGLSNSEWGPQTGELHGGCTCKGTMVGTRWCNNGDGSVTDMLGYNGSGACLVWLQDAGCLGIKPWSGTDNAHMAAGFLHEGECNLTDHSYYGAWRLPTQDDFLNIVRGIEPISSSSMQAFTNVSSGNYWTRTSDGSTGTNAYSMNLVSGSPAFGSRTIYVHVWPVRDAK